MLGVLPSGPASATRGGINRQQIARNKMVESNGTHHGDEPLRPRQTFEGSGGPLSLPRGRPWNKQFDCPQNRIHLSLTRLNSDEQKIVAAIADQSEPVFSKSA